MISKRIMTSAKLSIAVFSSIFLNFLLSFWLGPQSLWATEKNFEKRILERVASRQRLKGAAHLHRLFFCVL